MFWWITRRINDFFIHNVNDAFIMKNVNIPNCKHNINNGGLDSAK